jgi:hypothetical protein
VPASEVVAFGVVSHTRPSRDVCRTRRSGSTAIAIGSPVLPASRASVVTSNSLSAGGPCAAATPGTPSTAQTTSTQHDVVLTQRAMTGPRDTLDDFWVALAES